jgi:hypothetical protein
LRRENKSKSKVTHDKSAATVTMKYGVVNVLAPQAKVKAPYIYRWYLEKHVTSGGVVAPPGERVRQRTKSLASNRGDIRASRNDVGDGATAVVAIDGADGDVE